MTLSFNEEFNKDEPEAIQAQEQPTPGTSDLTAVRQDSAGSRPAPTRPNAGESNSWYRADEEQEHCPALLISFDL